ncbi:hypothetical protein HZS_6583, partial [Henneguya salminicola]
FDQLIQELQSKSLSSRCFDYVLFILYLINDSLFHCYRHIIDSYTVLLDIMIKTIPSLFEHIVSLISSKDQENKLYDLFHFWQQYLFFEGSDEVYSKILNSLTLPGILYMSNFLAYYHMPAGVMLDQITLSDCAYDSIDPHNLHMPLPQPPSNRLREAIDLFYSDPSTRDGMGWEKDGLINFFAMKSPYLKAYKE